jgi:hypothetical protein
MNDSTVDMERMVAAHYAAMTSLERLSIMASMRDTAIAIIETSLPPNLTREQRRYSVAKRMYGNELPEAALLAHASYRPPESRA